MGLFHRWQAEYAAHNVVTFPIAGNKKPAVTNWQRAGLNASQQWALKFPDAEAFAFLAGPRNRITVLDYDSKDERGFADEIARYGEPAIIVRSGSGNLQGWYRHNGEARRVRPDPRKPVDILGNGQVVAPPSRGSKAPYQFIKGTLDDLDRMTIMRNADDLKRAETAAKAIPATGERVRQGGRREALLAFLRKQANHCVTIDDMMDVAFGFANDMLDRHDGHAFTDNEIKATARSVWDWTEKGHNFVGKGRHIVTSYDDFDALAAYGPDACFLEQYLRRHHWGREFKILNDMRHTIPGGAWSLKRIQDARAALIQAGRIEEVKQASSYTGPAVYKWK